jgi:hypothetical protein
MIRDPLTKGFWVDLFRYLTGEGHEVTIPQWLDKRGTQMLWK